MFLRQLNKEYLLVSLGASSAVRRQLPAARERQAAIFREASPAGNAPAGPRKHGNIANVNVARLPALRYDSDRKRRKRDDVSAAAVTLSFTSASAAERRWLQMALEIVHHKQGFQRRGSPRFPIGLRSLYDGVDLQARRHLMMFGFNVDGKLEIRALLGREPASVELIWAALRDRKLAE